MKKFFSVFVSALLLSLFIAGGLNYIKQTNHPSHYEVFPLDLPDQH